jgi:hypothetical protein
MQSCYAVHTIKTDVKREKNITEKTEFPVTNKQGMRKNYLQYNYPYMVLLE